MLMNKMMEKINDINELSSNTLFYSPVEIIRNGKGSGSGTGSGENMHTYSVFDLDLTTMLFHFYFLSIFTDLISLQDDIEILQLPLIKLQEKQNEQGDERLFMTKANEVDVLMGNKAELADKIANIIILFTDVISKDKKAINYNYQQFSSTSVLCS